MPVALMDFSTSATKCQLEFSVVLHVLFISARASFRLDATLRFGR
jgi:hypothetical protein